MILALLIVGEFRDGLFVGGVVAANVAVATLQELVATRRLRALRALTVLEARVVRDGRPRTIAASEVVEGDLVQLGLGDQVVADGRVTSGSVQVDESLLTGESDPVDRTQGEALRSGSFCVAGECHYVVERVGAAAYAMRLTADAQALSRRRTPLQYRFQRLMRVLLFATGALAAALLIQFNIEDRGLAEALRASTATVTTVVPVGLFLGMTVVITVGALRVSRAGAIVQDIHAVEALNYVNVVAFDKTGTLTSNRLQLAAVSWEHASEALEPWLGAFAEATAHESKTAAALAAALASRSNGATVVERVPFSSAHGWSAATLLHASERRTLVLGATETIHAGAGLEPTAQGPASEAAARGLRVLTLAEAPTLPRGDAPLEGLQPRALLTFRDELRPEIREAFALMTELGIEPKVISGDNPRTVEALLRQLGIQSAGSSITGPQLRVMTEERLDEAVARSTVFGRVQPEDKARIVESLKRRGHFVAMVGDGANDVQALQRADVAVAMASGTAIARSVAGIVLLEDSFAALIRGTREATFVLGNTLRLSKLFLAKSVYAYLLILVTNMLGLDFPFLPRQGSVTALLTLGIPALFISISVPPRSNGSHFTREVMRFALPAGVALAASTVVLQFAIEGLLGIGIEEARTLVALTIVVVGVAYVVEVLGLEGASVRNPTRPLLTFALAIGLLAILVWTVETGWVRRFFAFTPVSASNWIVIGVTSALTLVAQYAVTRYWRRALDIVTGRPTSEESRGREPATRRQR